MPDHQELANAFYKALKGDDPSIFDFLRRQGGSVEWITALADKVKREPKIKMDQMVADLVQHYGMVDEKESRGIKKGMLWSRSMPKNIQKEMFECKKCQLDMEKLKKLEVSHVIDMHPDMCLFCGNGTDKGFTEGNVKFTARVVK